MKKPIFWKKTKPNYPRVKIDKWYDLSIDLFWGLLFIIVCLSICLDICHRMGAAKDIYMEGSSIINGLFISLEIITILLVINMVILFVLARTHDRQVKQWIALQYYQGNEEECANLLDPQVPTNVYILYGDNGEGRLMTEEEYNKYVHMDEEVCLKIQSIFGDDIDSEKIKQLLWEAGARKKTRNANSTTYGHNGTAICAMLMALTKEGYLEEKWQGRRSDTMDWLSAVLGEDIREDKHFLDYYCEQRDAKPYLKMIDEYRKLVVETMSELK